MRLPVAAKIAFSTAGAATASGADTVMMQNWGPTWAAVFMRSFITNADLFAYGMFAAILFHYACILLHIGLAYGRTRLFFAVQWNQSKLTGSLMK